MYRKGSRRPRLEDRGGAEPAGGLAGGPGDVGDGGVDDVLSTELGRDGAALSGGAAGDDVRDAAGAQREEQPDADLAEAGDNRELAASLSRPWTWGPSGPRNCWPL